MAPDSDSEGAAMAATMGFSSFGGRPATKKRKFNPTTDAFVEGQELEKIDRGGKKGTGSGGNMIPLGKTRVIGGGGGQKREEMRRSVQNEEEIAADHWDEMEMGDKMGNGGVDEFREGEGSEDEGPSYIDTSRTPPAGEDNGPRYIDTSEPPPMVVACEPATVVAEDPVSQAEALEMQRRIDAILQSIGSAPPPPSDESNILPSGNHTQRTTNMLSPLLPPPENLPNRAAAAFGTDSTSSPFAHGISRVGSMGGSSRGARSGAGSYWGGSSRGGSSRGGGDSGRGGRNDRWWVDYYDPGFNTNPWEVLDREKGLSSIGTWLEYPKGQARGGQRA
ncbi:uncharacterized protein RSE6_06303 [Rhynchosporium secalis]|uniref:Uncharacterized protein n=1 Tax=Rhynchosporium secalis TaxID=38038 RepID=A0A1E1MA03_RHYSE|nr:uncharacterized protein RSE6_06303 [Rhynchosporium secalis]